MARQVWRGSISFGLVNVGVRAYPATRDSQVRFHQIDRGTGSRIGYEKVAKSTGERVERDDIAMGYEIEPGRYVTFDPDELSELRPRSTRSLEISDFVDLEAIDPVHYERTYWLAPADDAARTAYALLATAMQRRQRVGIGSVVMRTKQYLAAVRPVDGVLAMSTMRYADDLVPAEDVPGLDELEEPAERQLELAEQIIDGLESDWDPEKYHDTYTEQLCAMIEERAAGHEITEEPGVEGEESGRLVDLTAALEASVEEARRPREQSA